MQLLPYGSNESPCRHLQRLFCSCTFKVLVKLQTIEVGTEDTLAILRRDRRTGAAGFPLEKGDLRSVVHLGSRNSLHTRRAGATACRQVLHGPLVTGQACPHSVWNTGLGADQ